MWQFDPLLTSVVSREIRGERVSWNGGTADPGGWEPIFSLGAQREVLRKAVLSP